MGEKAELESWGEAWWRGTVCLYEYMYRNFLHSTLLSRKLFVKSFIFFHIFYRYLLNAHYGLVFFLVFTSLMIGHIFPVLVTWFTHFSFSEIGMHVPIDVITKFSFLWDYSFFFFFFPAPVTFRIYRAKNWTCTTAASWATMVTTLISNLLGTRGCKLRSIL